MVKDAFAEFKHEHHFTKSNSGTLMTDFFDYESPFGLLGKLADKLFLKKYMTKLLIERNRILKEFAESDKWKEIRQLSDENIEMIGRRTCTLNT